MRVALGIALAAVLLAAAPAGATFPGRNGDLLVTEVTSSKYQNQRTSVLRIDPRSGRIRQLPVCAILDGLQHGQLPTCILAGPPAAAPDGRRVAVVSVDPLDELGNARAWNLRVISLEDGSQAHTPLSGPAPLLPTLAPVVRWSADAAGVLLLRPLHEVTDWWAPPPPGRAVLVGLDGGERAELAPAVSSPDLAPDGRLAFVRDGDVYVQAPGQSPRRLTRRGGDQPAWSPGGRFIAFSRGRHVFVVRATGGRARRLARGHEPVWSPDGRRIAFFRRVPVNVFGDDVAWELHVFALTRRTGKVRRITSRGLLNDSTTELIRGGLEWQPLPPRP
jgi:WD40-like Beta Propeller Repeat